MDAIVDFLASYGYWGLFIGAFLAGSVLPFNSEAVMAFLVLKGFDPLLLMIYGTAGNFFGSVFNYFVGRMGKVEWISKYLKVRPDRLEKAQRWVGKYGPWTGLLAWIPLLGSAVTVALGLMRSNMPLTFLSIFIGKLARYVIVVYLANIVS